MKTIIRFRDDNGNIVGSVREEEVKTPNNVLFEFSIGLAVVGLIVWIILL